MHRIAIVWPLRESAPASVEGGMRVHHYRLGKEIRLNRAEQFFAQARETVREAYAGDIVGLYDPGIFRIGDTISTGGPMTFDAVPRFSPEHFGRLVCAGSAKTEAVCKRAFKNFLKRVRSNSSPNQGARKIRFAA